MEDPSPSAPELVLTQRAVDRLRAMLEETGETHCRLRIEVTGSEREPNYIFSIEEPTPGDAMTLDFVHIGVVLDPESRQCLRGREVDYRDDTDGERFVIRRGG